MSDAWTRRKLMLYAATLVVLGAVFLRVDTLGARPLWADERAVDAFVAEAERDGVGAAAAPRASGQLTEAHLAPLHVMLAYASAQALGRSSIALRLPSVLASVATVLLVIALGTTLFDQRVGLVAGALVAISPYQIEYAQNARSYALFVALASAQLLAWFRFAATHHMGWLVAFTLTGAASAYAHHLGLLNQAAFGVLALANAAGDRLATRSPARHRALGRRELLLLAGAFTAMGLLYLPQLAASSASSIRASPSRSCGSRLRRASRTRSPDSGAAAAAPPPCSTRRSS
jgi:mannosyltransferase